ncbi:hypothetical protein GCM10009000_073430 [Halobacterium noricense]|uniref:Transposase n=1 Tax=Haladaptatus pallidirubidus TaxID=1008152 RepID=A0AAV3ULS4_9EURY
MRRSLIKQAKQSFALFDEATLRRPGDYVTKNGLVRARGIEYQIPGVRLRRETKSFVLAVRADFYNLK